ncbi:unnamed protein product [Cyclocybe aegerita]|uniref:DUF6699 domain-containing protein n=1 Tax=Cyclocybe aegerita TaxID=1973307 RepID=A0A8S0XYJ2_CYCAE|nr:unnamed protein product [Cyclocybe aegerita]
MSSSRSGPRESFQHHAGQYRNISLADITKPWEWTPVTTHSLPMSPMKPVFDIPKAIPSGLSTPSMSLSFPIAEVTIPTRKLSLWARVIRFFKSGSFAKMETVKVGIPIYNPSVHDILPTKVEPHEWKQYGYWARPCINEVQCRNSPASGEKPIGTEALKDLMMSLRTPPPPNRFILPDNTYPGRWIPGLQHPSLPPRPTRWQRPVPGEPLPFPWEVQINPLLQHLLWGPSPLSWCLASDPDLPSLFYGRANALIPCSEADKSQPATYPFLTHMHFNAVAGDTAPIFPWPFTVKNDKGITVRDVLKEMYAHFKVPVKEDEKASWPPIRQSAAIKALRARCELFSDSTGSDFRDVMRRCDALGGVAWFRGIEPTIDGGGWMITFGTH